MAYTYGTPEWEAAFVKLTKDRIATQPRPFVVFSPEWVGEWEQRIQQDAKYKEVAIPTWESSVCIHLIKKPEWGIDQDIYVNMDLWHTGLRSIRFVPDTVGKKADFVCTGTVERWLAVGRKQLDMIKGMMQGKLKLKGELPTMVRAIKPVLRIVEMVGEVGGKYPDELNPQEIEGFRKMIKDLATDFNVT